MLQELIHPLMLVSKADHDKELISPSEFQRRLAFCTRNLNTAKKCLRGGFTSVEDFIRQQKSTKTAIGVGKEDLVAALHRVTIAHKPKS